MTQQMSHEVYKVAAVLLLGILTLASCYSVMPINDAKNVKENKRTAKTVIADTTPKAPRQCKYIESTLDDEQQNCSKPMRAVYNTPHEEFPLLCL